MAANTVFGINIEGIQDVVQALQLIESRFTGLDKAVAKVTDTAAKNKSAIDSVNKSVGEGAKSQGQMNDSLSEFNDRLGIAIQKIISYRIAFGAFREATEAFQQVIDITIEMDDILGDLEKVLEVDTRAFEVLERQAFAFGKEFGRTGAEVARSFLVFGQQGLDTNEIIDRTRATLLAVSASTLTVEQAVESLTAVFKSFGGDVNSATDAVDKWARVAATAPVTAKDLADAVLQVGVAANQVGLSLDEINGIVAAVAEVTRKSGKNIGNSLKTIFARVRRPEVITQLQQLGVLSQTSRDTFRDFGVVLRELDKNWEGLSQAQQFNIAVTASGIRRYNDFLALMKNFDQFQDSVVESTNSLGFAQQATLAETEKFSRQIQALQTNIQELGNALGKAGIVELIILLNSVVSGFADVIKGNERELVRWNSALLAGVVGGAALSGVIRILTVTFTAGLASISGMAGALGILAVALNAAVIFFNNSRSQARRFNEVLDDVRQGIEGTERAAARLQGVQALQQFEDDLSIKRFNRSIAETEQSISNLEQEINDLETGLDLSDLITDFELLIAALADTRGGGEGNVSSVQQRRIQALQEEKRLLDARIQAETALRRQLEGGREATFEEINAENLERSNIQLENARDALNSLRNAAESATGQVISFPGLDRIVLTNGDVIQGLEAIKVNLNDIDTEGGFAISNVLQILQRFVDQAQKAAEEARSAGEETEKLGDQGLFRLINPVTRAQEAFSALELSVTGINDRIANSALQTELLGQAFDPVTAEVEDLFSALDNARSINSKFTKDLEVARIRAAAAGVDITKTEQERQVFAERIAQSLEAEGASAEDLVKAGTKFLEVLREQEISQSLLEDIEKRLVARIEDGTDALRIRRDLVGQIRRDVVEETSALNQQKAVLEFVSKAVTGISRSRLLESRTLSQQQVLQNRIAAIDRQSRDNAIIKKTQQELINLGITREEAARKNLVQLQNEENDLLRSKKTFEEDILKIRLRSVENLIRENTALVNSFSQALSGGLAGLSEQLTRRRDAEEELAVRRLELESQLTNARIAGDQEAINNALTGLQRLSEEAEKIGSFGEDLFFALEGVADSARNKLAEILSDELLNLQLGNLTIGEQLADGVLLGSTEGAIIFRNQLITASQIGGNAMAAAILQAHIQGANLINPGGDFSEAADALTDLDLSGDLERATTDGANKLKGALDSGFALGAQLLGQSLFGGGRGAALGSTLGSSFGSLLGPLGTIGGSLVGGFIGSLFDDDAREPILATNTEALNRNTIAIENNNRLLELQREFINAPTRFVAPSTQGQFGGGIANGEINININGGNANVGQQVVDAINEAFSATGRTTGRSTAFNR